MMELTGDQIIWIHNTMPEALGALAVNGQARADFSDVGLKMSGYWVGDLIRIDIKENK